MKRLSSPLLLGSVLIVLLSSGCTHTLEVKTLSRYQTASIQPLPSRPTIGIIAPANDVTSRRLVTEIGSELSKYADVTSPYTADGKEVQYVANIGVASRYKGSGINFLINFPGFLIFTPAWHGYVYNVNYDIGVTLARQPGGEVIDSFQLPIYLSVRQASINRTWTEISWLEVGVIAFVGGCVFVRYDDNVTPLLLDKVGPPLSKYVVNEILQRLASGPVPKPVEPPPAPPNLESSPRPPPEPAEPPKPEPAPPPAPSSSSAVPEEPMGQPQSTSEMPAPGK